MKAHAFEYVEIEEIFGAYRVYLKDLAFIGVYYNERDALLVAYTLENLMYAHHS